MLEQVSAPLVITNFMGRIEIVNSALCKLYGCQDADELKGKDISVFTTEEDAQFYAQQIPNYYLTHMSFTLNKMVTRYMRRRNGELLKINVFTRMVKPSSGNHKDTRFIACFTLPT
uniref:Folliculin n=1 Tax=Lygus hesperus TaxID=30085 RepID=A0A0A9YCX0_LYGHE